MKRLIKTVSGIGLCLTTLAAMTSCLNDDSPYQAGFVFNKPNKAVNVLYANTPTDTILFYSYGSWNVARSNGSWCQMTTTKGAGNTIYSIPLSFEPNTTGQGRGTELHFTDTEHPGEASATLLYWQYATRGDGSLGSAPCVKAITGTDGSRFEFAYDELQRPLQMSIRSNDNGASRTLAFIYDDRDSMLTVVDNGKNMQSRYGRDNQPYRLIGSGDTIGYYSQFYPNGVPVSANYAFNVEHHSLLGQNVYYAYKLGGQRLDPDSLHCADSLRIARLEEGKATVEEQKLVYSKVDNRCQNLDVNQLVFGTALCDPYQLLSLFRYSRSTSIVSQVEGKDRHYQVQVGLNADKSVARLSVSGTAQGQPFEVAYDFEY